MGEKIIEKTGEIKPIYFQLKFIDSYQNLSDSIDQLSKSLPKDGFQILDKYFSEKRIDSEILQRKGVMMHDYVTDDEVLCETELPPKEKVYNSLTEKHITDEEYEYAKKVWEHTGCQNIGDYYKNYLLCDILLLADIWNNYFKLSLENYMD